jgi:hypothetical protein
VSELSIAALLLDRRWITHRSGGRAVHITTTRRDWLADELSITTDG